MTTASDPIFLVVRRSANGEEWMDLGTAAWTEEGCRANYEIGKQKASRQFNEDNPPVKVVRRWLEERG